MTNTATTIHTEPAASHTATFDKKALCEALKLAKHAVNPKASAEAGACIRIKDGTLIASDGDMTITKSGPMAGFDLLLNHGDISRVVKPAKGSGKGSAAVMLTMLEAPTIHYRDKHSYETGPDRVAYWKPGIVKAAVGAASFQLPAYSPEILKTESAPFQDAANLATYRMDQSEFAAMITYCRHAISTEETCYYLNGVFLHFVAGHGLRAVATDGHRLAQYDAKALVPSNLPGVIMPTAAVDAALAAIGPKPSGLLKVTCDTAHIRITIGDTVITSKVIDGTFPDYERVIPRNNDKIVRMDCQALAMAAKTATAICKADSRAVKFTFSGSTAKLEAKDGAGRNSSQEIECDWQHADEFTIGFNGRYVVDAMAQVTGNDGVAEFAFNDANSPVTVRDPRNPKGIMALMPMRVRD